ncbi:hypothetical protein T484DRAFT_1913711 [Baffinella frigidus]|nr:hypothetical protein T484DRAFT_1913711 [Cryptophyta sp. CCMP2293]
MEGREGARSDTDPRRSVPDPVQSNDGEATGDEDGWMDEGGPATTQPAWSPDAVDSLVLRGYQSGPGEVANGGNAGFVGEEAVMDRNWDVVGSFGGEDRKEWQAEAEEVGDSDGGGEWQAEAEESDDSGGGVLAARWEAMARTQLQVYRLRNAAALEPLLHVLQSLVPLEPTRDAPARHNFAVAAFRVLGEEASLSLRERIARVLRGGASLVRGTGMAIVLREGEGASWGGGGEVLLSIEFDQKDPP